jgi:hypothetical protein
MINNWIKDKNWILKKKFMGSFLFQIFSIDNFFTPSQISQNN